MVRGLRRRSSRALRQDVALVARRRRRRRRDRRRRRASAPTTSPPSRRERASRTTRPRLGPGAPTRGALRARRRGARAARGASAPRARALELAFASDAARRAAEAARPTSAAERIALAAHAAALDERAGGGEGARRADRDPRRSRDVRAPVLPARAQGRRRHRGRRLEPQAPAARQDPAALRPEGRRDRAARPRVPRHARGRSSSRDAPRLAAPRARRCCSPRGRRAPRRRRRRATSRARTARARRERARGGIVRRHAARPARSPTSRRAASSRSRCGAGRRRRRRSAARCSQIVQKQFDERRRFLADNYEQAIRDLEVLERNEREAAIARFEEFLARYPDDPQYTPDAMFRLAELYYEKANDDFELALEAHREEAKRGGRGGARAAARADEELRAVHRALPAAHHRLPGLPVHHGMYYLLAYCLGEMGQGEEAQVAYRDAHRALPGEPVRARGVGAARRLALRRGEGGLAPERGRGVLADVRLPRAPALRPRHLQARLDLLPDGRLRARGRLVHAAARPLRRALAKQDRREARRRRLARGDPVHRHQLLRRDVGRRRAGEGVLRGEGRPPLRGRGLRAPRRRLLRRDEVRARGRGLPAGARSPIRSRRTRRKIQAKIVLAWSRDRQFDKEAAEREMLVRDLRRGDALVGEEQGRSRPPRGACASSSEKSLLRGGELPPRAGAGVQGRREARGGRRGVPRRGARLRRLPRALPALEAGVRALLQLRRLPLQRPRVRRRRPRVRRGPRRSRRRPVRGRGGALGGHLLGGRDHPAAAAAASSRSARSSSPPTAREKERRAGRAAPLRVRPPRARTRTCCSRATPTTRRRAAIAYKAGEVFYKYGDFDEARCRFEEVVARWPRSRGRAVRGEPHHRELPHDEGLGGGRAGLGAAAVVRGREEPEAPHHAPEVQARRPLQAGHAAHGGEGVGGGGEALPRPRRGGAGSTSSPTRRSTTRRAATRARAASRARCACTSGIPVEYPRARRSPTRRSSASAATPRTPTTSTRRSSATWRSSRTTPPRSTARTRSTTRRARSRTCSATTSAAAAFAALREGSTRTRRTPRARSSTPRSSTRRRRTGRREIQALQEFVKRFSRTKEHELVVQAHLEIALAPPGARRREGGAGELPGGRRGVREARPQARREPARRRRGRRGALPARRVRLRALRPDRAPGDRPTRRSSRRRSRRSSPRRRRSRRSTTR